MIEAFTWATAHHLGGVLAGQACLRHRVFVERQGWEVPSYNGMEHDQFDTPAAVYLVWRDDSGEVRGLARLLPTTRPYMLQQLWPHLVTECPSAPDVWEVTRYGVDHDLPPALRRRVAGEIIVACQEFGLALGVRRYLIVTQPLIVKLTVGTLGLPHTVLVEGAVGRHRVAVAAVDVAPDALNTARSRLGLERPVLTLVGMAVREAA